MDDKAGDGRRALTVAVALTCAAALAFLFWRLSRQSIFSMDFRYIWVAGQVWADGHNPYSSDYAVAGSQAFPAGYPVNNWVYPFHWFPVARVLALLPPDQSFAVYVALITVGLAVAFALMGVTATRLGAVLALPNLLIGGTYLCLATPLTSVLHNGQPAALALIGIPILLFGIVRRHVAIAAVGVALALLKPHLGIPVLAAVLLLPAGWRAVAGGGVVVLVGSLPAFLQTGATPQILALLRNASGEYQSVTYNSPAYMPGLAHWLHLARLGEVGISASLALATALIFAGSVLARHWPLQDRLIVAIGSSLTITAAVVGLHGHDLVILLLLLPFLSLMSVGQRALAAVGYLLLWRPENLARLADDELLTPTLQSIAAVLILAAWISLLWSMRRARMASNEPRTSAA